jgi:asparagine synthase (glutamine-hydrolysing)
MCGICGVAAFKDQLDPQIHAAVPAMAERIRHRGPDGDGFYADAHVSLAHRRLAIIDRAGGHQPMANEDESCWVVFNGEIYNHRELRERLTSMGHTFRTASDTEVILHGYEQWGQDAISRFEGMFAFALYDQRRHQLLIARDRLGKKPLFWAMLGRTLHFASEMKALMASPAWEGTVDTSTFEEYLSLGYILAPRTVYRGVHKLEPGHWLRFSRHGIDIQQYWDVTRFDDDTRPVSTLVGELDGLLRDRVADRLESEVPLGAFLSGGLDSGLIVSYMAEACAQPVRTTSVGFDSSDHNELAAARATAAHHRTLHDEATVTLQVGDVDPVGAAFDEPFADSSAVPTYHVSRIARQQVTVALSGDGGDEVFGGYGFRYVPHAIEAMVRPAFQHPAAREAVRWAASRWPTSRRLPRPLRLGGFLGNVARDPASAYYRDLCFLKPERARALLGLSQASGETAASAIVTDTYRRCPSPHALQRAQYADLKIYLPNDVLVKVDRMSMAHSLEVRAPLLDRRIIEFAFAVPPARKMPRLEPKELLRALGRSRLPAAILNLPKRGFTAPVGEWIAGAGATRFHDEVLSRDSHVRNWLNTRLIQSHWSDHRAGLADHSFELWAVWMLERWSRSANDTAARHLLPIAAAF